MGKGRRRPAACSTSWGDRRRAMSIQSKLVPYEQNRTARRSVIDALRDAGPRAERVLVEFARDNASLLALSMTFALLAYGRALVSPSLSLDEELVPAFAELGHTNGWSLALYRWGLVAFQATILPGAALPFLRPLLALAVLSVAATTYARLLPTSGAARHFFVLVFVTVPTFAYAMTFSFMCVEMALALLLFVLGLRCLVSALARPPVAPARIAAVVMLWVLASSFYQDLGVLLTAFLVYAFFCAAGARTQGLARQAGWFACLLSVTMVIYAAISVLIARAFGDPGVQYLQAMAGGTRSPALLGRFLRELGKFYGSSGPYGTATARLAAIALPLLGLSVGAPLRRRILLAALATSIAIAPLAYGLGVMPPLRAASGLLFLVAGAAAFAVARSGPASAFFVKLAVLWVVLVNCATVNNLFQYEALAWESDRMLANDLARRIHDVAADVHEQDGARVVFAGSYRAPLIDAPPGDVGGLWVGVFDTWGENEVLRRQHALLYLGFPAFRLGSTADFERSKPLLATMPAWPARGSVARDGDLVLVKLGELNGYSLP